ncbi:flagellar hook-basal body complex protein [Terasakiella sp. A23]|uniref:flagellar hook-basal body complex protein n=1 Tax=Terasakiella sp. FCG-A23 TaxID=3080561 RepID=UPI0029538933|nr:flagellar hook-basal body complex protein [Terasakiella sp. A23]MDV7339012.1 flagellar hook-basal body complex protein [Terasakiella sp. A23]
MSLYGALFSGVSGLQAQSSAMGAIADNVTNVNTTGYKNTTVNFQTLVTKQASLTKYSAGGVQSKPRQGVDVQGLLQSTSAATDIAISGNGLFIVNESGNPGTGDIYAYSRAGSFRVDKDGYLQNVSGYYLQGWPLQTYDGSTQAVTKTINDDTYMKAYQNSSGDTVYINDNIVDSDNLRSLNLKTIGGTAVASTTISMGANLPSEDAVGSTHKTDVLIYDSLGGAHNINHTWTKRASNGWDLSVVPPAGAESMVIEDQNTSRNNYMSIGRLDFASVPDSGTSMTLQIGSATYTIDFTTADDSVMDQDSFTITQPIDGDLVTIDGVSYEFDTDSTVTTAGAVQVTIANGASANTAAAALASAMETQMDSARGAGTWVSVANATISVNNTIAAAGNSTIGATLAKSNANGVNTNFGASATFAVTQGGAPGTHTNLDINVNSRSLSQVMDELGTRIQNLLQYHFGGVADSPPTTWAERIAGENAVVFHNVDTAETMTVDATALKTSGVDSVMQNTAFNVEAISSTVGWTSQTSHAVAFNGDGTPDKFFGTDEATASDPTIQYKINWANGAEDMDGSTSPALQVSLGNYNVADGITQFGGNYQINFISQNGAAFGNFAGVSINAEGVVTALFDNGVTRPVFMIPVATMVNPNGMESLSGNVWIETDFSGQPTVREAGSAGAGSVNQSSLEASTVDLGEEFTSMITTQRAYSAAAKIISTSDEMLEELLRVKR